jgi:hypothetical protein
MVNGFIVLVVQCLVDPILVAKPVCGPTSAAPRTASHIKLKNQITYLLLLNMARTRKKKRRDVAGMHMTYIQPSACCSAWQFAIGAAEVHKRYQLGIHASDFC